MNRKNPFKFILGRNKSPTWLVYFELLLLLMLGITTISNSQYFNRHSIKIGGLYDVRDIYEEAAFRHAAEIVNSEVERNTFPAYELSPRLEIVQNGDSYNASKKVCQLLKEGIGGIIGPQTGPTVSYVQSVSEIMHVPRIETKWDFRGTQGDYLINLYPDPETLSMAYGDIIKAWGWSKLIIIYENNESLFRLQGIFNLTGRGITEMIVKQLPEGDDYRPLMKELRKKHSDKTRIIIDCQSSKLPRIFEHAKSESLTNHNYAYFLTTLDIHTIQSEDISIGELNITAVRLVNPEDPKVQEVVELWKLKTTPSSNNFREFSQYRSSNLAAKMPELRNDMLKTETALLYDAMGLFIRAFHISASNNDPVRVESLDCDMPHVNPWSQGESLMSYMKDSQSDFNGLSGPIAIDADGHRRMFHLDVMELTQKKQNDTTETTRLVKIGEWNPKIRFNATRTEAETQRLRTEDLIGAHLRVTMKPSDPYCMKHPTIDGEFIGFGVDLLHKLSEAFRFNYTVHKVVDGKMGSRENDTNTYRYGWNGMIGEILEGKADLAVGDMSITSDRGQVVDFTMPFMNLGISLLYTKPPKKSTNLFQFLGPFHIDVWIYMATAYLAVSLILFILARLSAKEWQDTSRPNALPEDENVLENSFSMLNAHWLALGSLMGAGCDILPRITPYEWQNPHPCIDNPEELELNLHLINSLWFTIGSLMQQGSDIAPKITPYQWVNPHPCTEEPSELQNELTLSNCMWHNWGSLMQQGSDIAPKAGSTRMVAAIWWLFTLIMISSYTANLAAVLTSEGLEEGIKDVKDLPKQTKVKYGTMESGTTRNFFRDSPFPLYREIYKNMITMKPEPFVKDNQEGVKRVNNSEGRYAFFMESVSIEYQTERTCSLIQLGGLLDSKGYGIALKKGSKYRDAFNSKILEFSETGQLEALKKKWWKDEGGGQCKAVVASSGGATALGIAHVGGVFVVLVVGCGLACFMAMIEFLWKARKLARHGKDSFWTELKKEIKFALRFQEDTKPVNKPQSLNPSAKGESVSYLPLNIGSSNDKKEAVLLDQDQIT